jgi:hypothetical protein
MQQTSSKIGEVIKKKLSISDLADAFGISRPTLYRYIEYYDTDRRDSIPEHIVQYFDYISAEDVDGNDARVKLVAMKGDGDISPKNKPAVTYKSANVPSSNRWNEGEIRTLSVSEGGRTMVVFDGGFDPRYNLVLSLKIEGELHPIGEYRHAESRGFFVIDDVVPCKDLFYEVSYYDGIERRTSGHHPLGGGQ